MRFKSNNNKNSLINVSKFGIIVLFIKKELMRVVVFFYVIVVGMFIEFLKV